MLVGRSSKPYIRNTHCPAGQAGGGSYRGTFETLDFTPFGECETSQPPVRAAQQLARRLIRPLANSSSTISAGRPSIL